MKSAVLFTLVFTLMAAGCASESIVRRPNSCVQIERHLRSHTNLLGGHIVSDAELKATLRSERRSRTDAVAAQRLQVASWVAVGSALPLGAALGFASYAGRREDHLPALGALGVYAGTFVAHAVASAAFAHVSGERFNHAVNEYNALAADLGRCPVPPPEPSR